MNNSFLNSGVVGNIELNEQKRIREAIVNRWDKLGFTDGLQGHIKENIATLFENQAKTILSEATGANDSGSFETVVFPIIRRVFGRLLANDIVSVQAMNLPIGKLFFIKPVTSERQWEGLDGDGNIIEGSTGSHAGLMGYERENRHTGTFENRYYLPDTVINSTVSDRPIPTFDATGERNEPKVTQWMKKSLYDLFYDDFLYDNSKGKVHIKVGNSMPVVMHKDGTFGAITGGVGYPVSPLDGKIRTVILEVGGFSSHNAGRLTGPDGNEMDSEAFLASLKVMVGDADFEDEDNEGASEWVKGENVPFRVVTQKYGKGIVEYDSICDAEGKIYLEVDLSKEVAEAGLTIDGFIGINKDINFDENSFLVAWKQYDSLELETEIGEVSFKLDSVVVSVEARKLRATWSPELAQDVAAFHNIDAEAELTAILSEQVGAEIDREILRDLRKAAPWQDKFDVHGWKRMAGFSTNYTQKDWNQELIAAINRVSAQVHKSTLRGGANFIVVSSEVSALFDNLEYFHVSDASPEQDQYNMGIERIGSLSGRYQVYRDPYSPAESVIIGHKGKSLLDTGYIYAPYVPMQLTPTMYSPHNFAPVKGILTRYAKKVVNNRFYGHIRVVGLKTWSTKEFR